MAKTQEQMLAIERSLAYEFCESNINALTFHAEPEGEEPEAIWHDIMPPANEDDAQLLAEVVEYLDWRGLLVRHASNPNYVQILNEDAAAPQEAGTA